MLSRRSILLGGTLAASTVAGALVTGPLSHTGAVARKRIAVSWEWGGARKNGYLLQTVLGPDDELALWYAPTYAKGAVETPRKITIDRTLHNELTAEFSDVTYMIGVHGTATGEDSAYEMKQVGRNGFNQLQVGDTGTVSVLGDRLYVHSVDEMSDWSGTSNVRTFSFDRRDDHL